MRFDPEGIGHMIRHVAEFLPIPILVTENGIGTDDDTRRGEYIRRVIVGVKSCVDDGILVIGYIHWSLLDNFEWQEGFEKTFGLIAVDRATQKRAPKPSGPWPISVAGEKPKITYPLAFDHPGSITAEAKHGDVTLVRFDGDNGEYSLLLGNAKGIDGPKGMGTYL